MNNDYKNNILKYITNNIVESSGTNRPYFDNYSTLNTTILDKLQEELGNSATYSGYIVHQATQTIIAYGYYDNGGYICLFDINLEIKEIFTTLPSGSNLFRLIHLDQAEDGYFYGISQENNGTARVLLFNNFVANINNTYKLILRQSYIIPANLTFQSFNLYNMSVLKSIVKVPNSSIYYLIGKNNTYDSTLIKFTINVGSTNEWLVLSNTVNTTNNFDILIEKKSEEKYKLYLYECITQSADTYYKEMTIDQDNNIQYKNEMEWNSNTGITRHRPYCINAKNPNEIYTVYKDYSVPTYKLGLIKNGYIEPILTFNNDSIVNVIILDTIILQHYTNSELSVGMLVDNTLYSTSSYASTFNAYFVAFQIYNLVNIYLKKNNETIKWNIDYNPNNYNGTSYSAYNYLKSKKGRLISNGEIVFARNLYDITTNENITTSTLQVPNTMLNDITISSQYLINETNATIVYNQSSITKNIYETLYINFINTLNVIDSDTNTKYPQTATYINQNINIGTKENSKSVSVNKVRINYVGSSIVQNINWTYLSGYYQTSFVVDATNSKPTSIEFISNDEITTYITKTPTMTVGNYYVVKQKLKIE